LGLHGTTLNVRVSRTRGRVCGSLAEHQPLNEGALLGGVHVTGQSTEFVGRSTAVVVSIMEHPTNGNVAPAVRWSGILLVSLRGRGRCAVRSDYTATVC
jgi:hypothetical protein